MTDEARQVDTRSGVELTNRRSFLSEAGRYGAVLVGGTYVTAALGSRASAAQGGLQGTARAVQEKSMMVRIFGVAERAPGLLKAEIRGKSFISLLGYGTAGLQEATKVNDTRQALIFIQNFINDAAYGEGQMKCHALADRDFVAEYCMGVGDTVVGSVSGTIPPPPGQAGANGGGTEQATRLRVPTLPDYGENGTDLRVAARQVLAQGTRPLAITGREKGMHFIKMSSAVPVADHVKVWQTLHAKALEATPAFADALAGFEVLQRLPNTPSQQASRCGAEMPVPELVACFWSKTSSGAAEFASYVRALRKADQQAAIDGPASFFLLVEEWEVFVNPTFNG